MIVRNALLLVLILIAVGMIGRWNRRRLEKRPAPPPVESARRCPECGAYVVGAAPEPCARPDCRFRSA